MNTTSESHSIHSWVPLGGVASGSVTEGIGAIATIILAIIALAGIFANILASVATIVISGVILADSLLASAGARHTSQTVTAPREIGGGVTAGFFGGLAGIVLGILSFFRPVPNSLLAVAILVLGGALLLSGGIPRLFWAVQAGPENARNAMPATASGNLAVGIAVVVLGILAVVGLVPMTLILVGLLCLGTGALFSGAPATNSSGY